MPRPCKRRRVCGHPSCGRFGPAEQAHGQPEGLMGLDEFETIRLIDLEGLTQEQCAEAIGRSVSFVSQIEANNAAEVKGVSLETLFLMSEKLGISMARLFED